MANSSGVNKQLLFYDFEVLSKSRIPETNASWWCAVFIDYETGKGKIIKNDVELLRRFYEAHKDCIFVGYNSRQYDLYIFKGLLLGMDAGFINEKLITEKKKGFEVVRDAWRIQLYNFDCSTGFHSLKQLEAFMGSEIKESDVPFDIERPVTPLEEQNLIKYCVHDVRETIKVFNHLKHEFDSQLALIDTFDLDFTKFNKTKAQLSAVILGAVRTEDRGDVFDYQVPDCIVIEDYATVKEWYFKEENQDFSKKLEIDLYGVPHVFAFGGLHGSRDKYQAEGIILCCDVASLYPSIMINFDTLSRNVANPEKFREIRDERLRLKALKDARQQPMKIVLNGTFGASDDKYNALYDPRQSKSTCISGQLLLLDLIEKVAPYCELIQSNTDGLFLKVEDRETVQLIKEEAAKWERRTNLELEWEEFSRIYQKDVNNYILIKDDGTYKAKGAYVKKLNDLDYDLAIVNKAMVHYFVHGTPLEKTINECNVLRDFQKVIKLTAAYEDGAWKDCTFSKKKVMNEETRRMRTVETWNEDGERLKDKTFRVFASTRESDGGIFKKKFNKNPEKFANTPDKCFIENGDIVGRSVPEYLDKQFYIDLAQKRVNQYLGIKEEKKKKVQQTVEGDNANE